MAGIFVGFRSGLRLSLPARGLHRVADGAYAVKRLSRQKVGEVRARKLELRLLRCKALPWITQHERETRIS